MDTRDTDSLHLITEINGRPTVEITIFGPGADGETTALGLQLANEDLIKNNTVLLLLLVLISSYWSGGTSPTNILPGSRELLHGPILLGDQRSATL